MRKIKVALIHNIISPYRIPLFEELAKNTSIDLYIYFTSKSEENREWDVSKDHSFNYKILPGFILPIGVNAYFHINPTIITELLFGKFDVIISAGYSSFSNQIVQLMARILRTPFILWSGSTVNEPSKLRSLSLPLVKLIVKYADAYIAYGTNAKEYLVQLGAQRDKVFVSFNTVDTTFFGEQCVKCKSKKTILKNKFGINHENVILYVGQLIERKGVNYLLKTHEKLSDKHDVGLVLVGNGNQKQELMKLCEDNAIDNVYFIDFVQKDVLPQYYAIADVFVLPSTEEVWGLVINEAMACGLPIITTEKVGASVDLVQNGVNGFIVKEKSSDELTMALEKIFVTNGLKDKMSKSSRENLHQGFEIKDTAKGFIDAIQFVNPKKMSRCSKDKQK